MRSGAFVCCQDRPFPQERQADIQNDGNCGAAALSVSCNFAMHNTDGAAFQEVGRVPLVLRVLI